MKRFISGFITALVLAIAVYFLVGREKSMRDNPYIILNEDYKIEGVGGVIKKGTILKTDEAMSEGFTRFILYLNLKGGNYDLYREGKNKVIIPFLLNPLEDTLTTRK